jgi:hypothetical protein
MPSQYTANELVIARMQELADIRTSWHRSLWQVGSIVALREIVEATDSTWSGQLTSSEAMKDFIEGHARQIGLDHGLGRKSVRDRLWGLVQALPYKLAPDPRNQSHDGRAALDAIKELVVRAEDAYLHRWADHIDQNPLSTGDVELVARLIVAHLLDSGFHRSHIHGWLTNLPKDQSLPATLEHAQSMLAEDLRDFQLLVAVRVLPRTVLTTLPDDLRSEPAAYLEAFKAATNAASVKSPREPAAAISLAFTARDPHSAISEATSWIRKFTDRVAVGTGGSETIFEEEIVDLTTRKIRSFRDERRLVRVPSLQRNGLFGSITSSNSSDQIDDAIGLLAAQQQGTSAASIASAWAALEALLGMPGAKGVDAADRLADIVCCSFPRAEITQLAAYWEKHGSDALHEALKEQPSNEQARIMLEALIANGDPGFTTAKHVAAVNRVLQLASQQGDVLNRIRAYYRSAFRRLYYQRNFIMHAAKFDSVSLPATTRTVPQLVAAGVDRIVNARFGPQEVSALGLAARAQNELALIDTDGSRSLHNLLD